MFYGSSKLDTIHEETGAMDVDLPGEAMCAEEVVYDASIHGFPPPESLSHPLLGFSTARIAPGFPAPVRSFLRASRFPALR